MRHFRCMEFCPFVVWIWNQNISISTIVGTSSHINLNQIPETQISNRKRYGIWLLVYNSESTYLENFLSTSTSMVLTCKRSLTHHSSICDVLQHDNIYCIIKSQKCAYLQVIKIRIKSSSCSCCSATVVELSESALKFLTALYV